MKKITHVSDITGKDIIDHVQVSIKREGHDLKIGSDTYFGDTVFDVDVSELPSLLDKITFQKQMSPIHMDAPGPSVMAKAQFFSPGSQSISEDKIVSVDKPGAPPDTSGLTECP